LDRQVDGLIIALPAFADHQVLYLQQQQIPFVLVDRYFPEIKTNHVALDNYGAAFKGVEYLVKAGRKRIGMITYDTEVFTLQERKRGYTAALKQHKLPAPKSLVKEVNIKVEKAAVEKAIHALLAGPDPVDALLFGANNVAVAGLKCISAMPVKIPDDLMIVNFDETEALEFFYAPFAYIKQPLHEIGRLATHLLLEAIEKRNSITQINLEGELVLKTPSLPH
jgi:LacI family transcriptional regulator